MKFSSALGTNHFSDPAHLPTSATNLKTSNNELAHCGPEYQAHVEKVSKYFKPLKPITRQEFMAQLNKWKAKYELAPGEKRLHREDATTPELKQQYQNQKNKLKLGKIENRQEAAARILHAFSIPPESVGSQGIDLNLKDLGLSSLPPCVAHLQHVKRLNLEGNRLEKLAIRVLKYLPFIDEVKVSDHHALLVNYLSQEKYLDALGKYYDKRLKFMQKAGFEDAPSMALELHLQQRRPNLTDFEYTVRETRICGMLKVTQFLENTIQKGLKKEKLPNPEHALKSHSKTSKTSTTLPVEQPHSKPRTLGEMLIQAQARRLAQEKLTLENPPSSLQRSESDDTLSIWV